MFRQASLAFAAVTLGRGAMRRWDRLLDAYIEDYGARGVSPQEIAYTKARLDRWGRWLKGRRPRIGIEHIDQSWSAPVFRVFLIGTVLSWLAGPCAALFPPRNCQRKTEPSYGNLGTNLHFSDTPLRLISQTSNR
jgi:hypothetical protein